METFAETCSEDVRARTLRESETQYAGNPHVRVDEGADAPRPLCETSRRKFIGTSLAFAAGVGCASVCSGDETAQVLPFGGGSGSARSFSLDSRCTLRMPVAGIRKPVNFFVIGDTHFGFHDSRDDAYADNYKRMAQWPSPKDALAKALTRAKKAHADAVMLVGDIISFPSLANLDHLRAELDRFGLPWLYVAGNHDWHFEGDSGSDFEQRARWVERRLKPLYQGENPLMYARMVKGVRMVMIDNSAYHVTPEQLAFWKQEAAKGDPIALFMHIPLWIEGWSIITCGNPRWGAATDPYWKIERRERWAERLMPSTYAFREAVFNTPNLVGVFTGHIHSLMVGQAGNALLFSVPSNRDGSCMEVRLSPS